MDGRDGEKRQKKKGEKRPKIRIGHLEMSRQSAVREGHRQQRGAGEGKDSGIRRRRPVEKRPVSRP